MCRVQLGPREAHRAHNCRTSPREAGERHLAGGRGEPLRAQTWPRWTPEQVCPWALKRDPP